MTRTLSIVTFIVLGTGAWGCGGYRNAAPTGPSTPPPDNAITINIVAMNGAMSFSPDPATVAPGRVVVWHNVDTTTHHVVLNDNELDTGDIAPGAFSAPMPLVAASAYHCSIHPEMVGSIKAK
jgi:plastocyanin